MHGTVLWRSVISYAAPTQASPQLHAAPDRTAGRSAATGAPANDIRSGIS